MNTWLFYFFYIFLLLLIDLFHRLCTCSAYDVVPNTCAHKIWAARNLFKLCVATKNRDNGNLKLPSVINVQATLNTYFANWWILYFMPNWKWKREKKNSTKQDRKKKKTENKLDITRTCTLAYTFYILRFDQLEKEKIQYCSEHENTKAKHECIVNVETHDGYRVRLWLYTIIWEEIQRGWERERDRA